MIAKARILELLDSLHEHTMAKDIFVPVLKAMSLNGVKFTGGPDEQGIDVEYYELTEPEKRRSYVGIQFKKGSLVYGAGGKKDTVKEIKNQAEEAFEKEIVDVDNHTTININRYVVAVTGDINEKARAYIGKARRLGKDRGIDYWDGDRLAEYVQRYWMTDFHSYFKEEIKAHGTEPEADDIAIVDDDYIRENFSNLVTKAIKVAATVSGFEYKILRSLLEVGEFHYSGWPVPMSDLLLEMECTEDYVSEDLQHLIKLDYIEIIDHDLRIIGHASSLKDLASKILKELEDAGEDSDSGGTIFDDLVIR